MVAKQRNAWFSVYFGDLAYSMLANEVTREPVVNCESSCDPLQQNEWKEWSEPEGSRAHMAICFLASGKNIDASAIFSKKNPLLR